jgi:Mg/Co/Ni transporter MgtE
LAAGEPTEGPGPSRRRVGSIVDRDVVTVGLDSRAGDVLRRLAGRDLAVVVDERIVLGIVRGAALEVASDRPVGELMEEGPSTVRADAAIEDLAKRDTDTFVVTTPQGALVGVARIGTD